MVGDECVSRQSTRIIVGTENGNNILQYRYIMYSIQSASRLKT